MPVCATTTKPINLGQLSAELAVILGIAPNTQAVVDGTHPGVGINGDQNVGIEDNTESKTVCYSEDPPPGTLAQLNTAISNHVFDRTFGRTTLEKNLIALKQIIDDVQSGRKTSFDNPAQRDRVIALVAKVVLNMNGL